MSQSQPKLRRTRIVCISDTHNSTVKLPDGDVLIHAGDITNQGTHSELSKAIKWLEDAKFEAKIVIAGNHDITLDKDFYAEYGHTFHNQNPQSHDDCLSVLTSAPSITYLNHGAVTVRLTSPQGPQTQFKIFGSPYSPRHGLWAFAYDAPQQAQTSFPDLPTLWDDIPLDADIVVTHTPARTHCDETDERRATGCEALRRQLWRVRPRLAVCGHIHDGRGAQRLIWDLSSRNVAFAEHSVTNWTDPELTSNKLSLVDLTGRKAPTLANDGISPPPRKLSVPSFSSTTNPPPPSNPSGRATTSSTPNAVDAQACSSTIGLGGDDPSSPRCDWEALRGRMGRRETCIINAAIMKSRYPHVGGKKFNKPIVVDIDLPIWQSEN